MKEMVFLMRPACSRCKVIQPKAEKFAKNNNMEFTVRNVDEGMLPQDVHVGMKTGQKSLPIVYMTGVNAWTSINPNTWNFEEAYELFVETEDQYLTYEEE